MTATGHNEVDAELGESPERARLSALSDRLGAAFQAELGRAIAPVVKAARTLYLYSSDLRHFYDYLLERRRKARRAQAPLDGATVSSSDSLTNLPRHLPISPEEVVAYFDQPELRDRVPLTDRAAAAIGKLHQVFDFPNPCADDIVRGQRIGRRHQMGFRSSRHLRFGPEFLLLAGMSIPEDDDVLTARARCLILLGFAGGLTPKELTTLSCDQITIGDHDMVLRHRRDPWRILREPDTLHICPVRATERWMAASGVSTGPLLRPIRPGARPPQIVDGELSLQVLGEVFNDALTRAGYDPKLYKVSSLRSGFLSTQRAHEQTPAWPPVVQLSRFLQWALG